MLREAIKEKTFLKVIHKNEKIPSSHIPVKYKALIRKIFFRLITNYLILLCNQGEIGHKYPKVKFNN